ncbi:MAG TPA: SDR family NAD(P)-dependent oxidoreductase [Candidatus Binatia bacterium]|nr:SDR family NAD(P)-dependent oxidoreductase [Candidatus Binatia bacterium]
MKTFQDKVAAITGAGSGIGRALAIELSGAGCEVALSDIDQAGLEETAAILRVGGIRATTARLDVADRAAVYAWADEVVAQHGRVHMVFNNAGVGIGSTLEGISYEDFEWVMNINFWGVVYGTKAFLPHLRASGEGHVVNISSLFGILSVPGNGAYNASEFAVRGFTEALRQELELTGGNVSATCVHPGGIKTNIARSGRMSDNLKDLHMPDPDTARAEFEKFFITTPQSAARTILRAVQRNQRRVLIGPDARTLDFVARLMPQGYQRVILRNFRRRMR